MKPLPFRLFIRVKCDSGEKNAVEARIRGALQAAQKYDLVANSIKSEIVTEPETAVTVRAESATVQNHK